MNKQVEKFLLFCDKHHIAILNINLFVFAAATIILFCFNDNQVTFEFCAVVTIFPIIFFLNGYRQSQKCTKDNKRVFTLIFLAYLFTSLTLMLGYIWCSLTSDSSGTGVFVFVIPMVLFAVIVGIKIFPVVFKKAKNDLIFLFKFFIGK